MFRFKFLILFMAIAIPSFAQTARLQVIHNAADPLAASVDVYINGNKALDNFAYRTATPFIDVPSGVDLNIGIAPGTSGSVNDTLKNFLVKFAPNEKYVAIANGVLNPANFSANPNGRSIAFTIFAKDKIRENGTSSSYVDAIIVHGSTDAPTVDVNAKSSGSWWPTKLVNDASYGDITSYKKLSPKSYILDVTPGNSNTVVASFTANLNGLGGGAAVVFASGFLNPSANQNGAAFGLFAAYQMEQSLSFLRCCQKLVCR